LSGDSLAGFDFQGSRSRGILGGEQRDWLIFISGHLESKPWLAAGVMKVDIAACKICDCHCCYHGFVSNVLQTFEF